VEPAFTGADLGDISSPEHVGSDRIEVAAYQVGRDDDAVSPCGAPAASGVCADLMVQAHQAGDPFAAAAPAGAGQFGVHARRAIGAVRALIDSGDRLTQLRVGGLPRRSRSGEEGVEARAGDREDPAEPLDAVGVSMIGDESEAADRIVSWAKWAAALRRISFSTRSSATSRRSRRSSSNSDGLTDSGFACRASSAR